MSTNYPARQDIIPEGERICKYCEYCGVPDENYDGISTCYLDIGEHVDVNNIACDFFIYDNTFPKT